MPNNQNDWNRNHRGSNRDWDDNDNRFSNDRSQDRDGNYDDRRSPNYGDRGSYGGPNERYNEGGNRGRDRGGSDYNEERYISDNDFSRNRGVYGNSTGVNRGSSSHLGGSGSDWNNRGGRGYPGSDYGHYGERYNSDRYSGGERDWWDKTKDEVSSWFGDDDAARRRQRDERTGQHKGKGPKGYSRSDERIREDVNDRLSDDPHVDASDIEVSVSNGEVTLTGTVSSRWEKRHAEDIVDNISGVKDVENRLKINSGSSSGSGSSTPAGSTGNAAASGVSGISGVSGVAGDEVNLSGGPYGSSGAAPVGAFDTSKT